MTPFASGLLAVFYCLGLTLSVSFWVANRQTSLAHAVLWAILAWIAWFLTLAVEPPGSGPGISIYLALALTGCASIAVLGARRPGVTMWNAVVLALLLMELSPWGEAALRQNDLRLDGLRLAILAGSIAIGVMNYLPTRAGLGALLVGFGCGCQWLRFMKADEGAHAELDWMGRCSLALAPEVIVLCHRLFRSRKPDDFDLYWIAFRERFGVVWGQRLREQFNQAAKHAGWKVTLTWLGLRVPPGGQQPSQEQRTAMMLTLNAAMKRFGNSNQV